MPDSPLLQISQLNISYKIGKQHLPAVRDFYLQLQKGKIYGVVGESGCGKSTVATGIMNYLSANGRFEPASSIRYYGDEITSKTRREMRHLWGTCIKMVPQDPGTALNPSIKVGEQVAEIARWHLGMNRSEALNATLNIFRKVHLADPENVIKRYPHQLSGGMQQRVVIAMALITEPQLLVLDEPTTGLDVTTEAVILDLICELITGTQAGAIYVTHNLGVVAQLCERVVVMYAGEIMEDGAVSELYAKPLHPYTIGLLNSIPKPGQSKREAALLSIEGHPPPLHALPSGCVFATRCPIVIDKCRTYKPTLEKTQRSLPGLVRCHRWQEIKAGEVSVVQKRSSGIQQIEHLEREPLLQATNLTKHFDVPRSFLDMLQGKIPPPVRAVDGINLGVQQGRTLGLVGESGSGKTTLARVIIGLSPRTEGKLELAGSEIRGDFRKRGRKILAQLQMIFQNPQDSLNPYLTVGQAIRRPLMKLANLERQQADEEVSRLLQAVNLQADYATRYPNELSGGEKQRVAIARAFASQPDLIICDETVSALDVSVQAAVLNLLARLQEKNDTAYIFISHDLAVVGYLADYLAVMYLGQLFEVGYGRDMFAPPYHPYTEALTSAIPVPDPSHQTKRILLSDKLPSARNLPTGCRFNTRCPHKIGDICENEIPPWRDDEQGHFIRCHIPLDELVQLQKARD